MKTPPKTKSAKSNTAKKKAATKPAVRKAVRKKAAPKKAAPRKAAPKKAAAKKAAPKKASPSQAVVPVDPAVALTALAVAALEDMKGLDIKVLDVRELTPITDAMVICTGTSNRHVKSLAQSVLDKAKHRGLRPHGVEGMADGEWVLVDLNGVVVHVMQAQARVFYQLEKLWDMAEQP